MIQLIAKKIYLFGFLLLTLLLAACSEKPGIVVADINFADPKLSPAVAEISGFSDPESWGRWSDADVAPTAKIRFKQPLPTQFTLTITGQTVPNNEDSVIKIGNFQEQLHLKKLKDVVVVDVTLAQPEDTIEIIPADPASPKKLGLNEDDRKLGVGLATLRIQVDKN